MQAPFVLSILLETINIETLRRFLRSRLMIGIKFTHRVLLACLCCFALIFVPVLASAQTPGDVIDKGAEGVQKGAETGAEKTQEGVQKAGEAAQEGVETTKEGAETTGKEMKKAVTGEETTTTTREKGETPSTEPSQVTGQEQKTESGVTKTEPSAGTTTTKPSTSTREKGEKRLPHTAGPLPLLALIGALALATSGTLRLLRRSR